MSKTGHQFEKEITMKKDGVSGQRMTTRTLLRLCATFEGVTGITLMVEPDEAKAVYFDVTANSSSDSTPVGSINRARSSAEVASRKARMAATHQTLN
jgi:hypothetical protein